MSVLLYEKHGEIAKIILNRPEKRNALNSAMIRGIGESLEKAADPEVKVLILCGAGEKAFTAGFDLKESMENNITDIVERRADTKSEIDFFMKLWHFPKPVIASVQGYCIGGGNTLSFMSDMIIAADNAQFGNPEMLLGYVPQIPIEIWKMPFNKAREWFYMSKYLSAQELHGLGVVNEVVPFEQLGERTMEVAKQIARVPADSMRMTKYALNKAYELQGLTHTIDFVSEMFNLGRTHMQQNEMAKFRDSINKGGLKAALDEQYK